jgi:hypothetical protein
MLNIKNRLSPVFVQKFQSLIQHLTSLHQRFPWAIPTLGFTSGAASFFLVEREQEKFAQIVAVLMLASWVWLALENLLRRGVSRWFGAPLPAPLLSFATQMVHQESLFFAIPFFFITTAWNTGQVVFTSLLMLFALVSIVDPIYFRWLAARRWRYFIFHGITLFGVLLIALPILIHLPTPQAYLWSLGAAILLSLPGIVRALPQPWWRRFIATAALLPLLAAAGYYARPWIPPATLRLTKVAVTDQIDNENRAPERALKVITDEQLRNGLYAYTAISAPRGLRERIYHEWRRNGRVVDRIALDINGGREAGYRAWTHKLNFPPYPVGRWEIHVLTEANQVIGILRFQVVKSAAPSEQPELYIPDESPMHMPDENPEPNDIAPQTPNDIPDAESSHEVKVEAAPELSPAEQDVNPAEAPAAPPQIEEPPPEADDTIAAPEH